MPSEEPIASLRTLPMTQSGLADSNGERAMGSIHFTSFERLRIHTKLCLEEMAYAQQNWDFSCSMARSGAISSGFDGLIAWFSRFFGGDERHLRWASERSSHLGGRGQ
jgi:hypothetical protein